MMSVTIEIDGKQVQAKEGMNLLEAALQNGVYIPHLCHHPDLPDIGSCRLCIVEVEGMEGGRRAHQRDGDSRAHDRRAGAARSVRRGAQRAVERGQR